MKRILLMLVLLMGVVTSAWAEKTPQAIWCRNNKTMYFTNDETVYAPGDTYDGETVTNVWSGVDVTNAIPDPDGYGMPKWYDIRNDVLTVCFDPSFSEVRPVTTESWFEEFRYLTSVEGLEYLNTSQVTRTVDMFYNCKSLGTLDVNSFDLHKVTHALAMFGSCENLTTIYCDNDWSEMFSEEQYIFWNCYKLKGAVSHRNYEPYVTSSMANPVTGYFTKRWPINFNLIGGGTIVASDENPYTNQTVTLAPVPDTGNAFFDILIAKDNLRIELIPFTDNGNGTYTFTMPPHEVYVDAWFAAATPQAIWCSGNSTLYFTNPVHQYQVGETFEGQEVTAVWSGDALTDTGTGAPGWSDYRSNVASVVFKHDFYYVHPESLCDWFRDMPNLSEIVGLEYLSTSQAVDMSHMFANCKSIQTLDLNTFDVMSSINTSSMFEGCENLTTIYCDKTWDLRALNSANMFLDCTKLKGAIAYDSNWTNGALANPVTGYFMKQWTLNVGNIEHGTVLLSEATPFTHELVTITLTPDADYRVKTFTLTGDSSGFDYYFTDNGDGTYSFFMPPEDVTLYVEFFCPTANAIWCEGNQTLYFDYDYAPSLGSIYEGQIVTKLWTGDGVANTGLNVPRWQSYAKDVKKVVFQTSFSTVRPKSLYYWFWNMSELETIEGIENLNTSETTNMSSMFFGCAKLTTLDVNGFDVGKLPFTISMFRECTNLTTIYCDKTWNNPNANNMFLDCVSLKGAVAYDDTKVNGTMANPATGYFTGKWNLNVGDHEYGTIELAQSWAYTNETVTVSFSPDDGYALYGCVVKGDRTGNEVEVTKADDGSYTFVMPAEAVTVSALFQLANEPFVVWCDDNKTLYFDCSLKPHVGDTYNGHSVTSVWSGEQVTETSIYYPYWHTSEVKKAVFSPAFANVRPNGCAYWFYGCSDLEEIEGLEYLNTSEVTTMVWMFRNCGALKTIDVNNFDMTNVTDVSYMFFDCYALTTIYCNNTWNVANSSSMFTYDTKLVGAVPYNSDYQDASMANPITGYFTGQWDVTVADNIEHGTVTCEKDWAYTNEIVTITFTPDEGYMLETPSVTIDSGDGQGGTISLSPGEVPGTYTFKMPAAPVIINASFATETILEVTLAELCENGVMRQKYTISDDLIAVACAKDGDGNVYLWCKDAGLDDNDQCTSINPSLLDPTADGYEDYMTEHSDFNGDWDQSNWIALKFYNYSVRDESSDLYNTIKGFVGWKIKEGTVKGIYVDNINYQLDMSTTNLEKIEPFEYPLNLYCPANFLSQNIDKDGAVGTTPISGITKHYFFMNPKVQEVCEITFAVWNGNYFVLPDPTQNGVMNNTNIPGAFNVAWEFNDIYVEDPDGGVPHDLRDDLVPGVTYKFNAIVQVKGSKKAGAPSLKDNPVTVNPGEYDPDLNYTVYPINFDPRDPESIVTAINGVTVNGEVKSVKYVNVAGIVSDRPFQGVNIVVTEYTDGSRTTSKMLKK